MTRLEQVAVLCLLALSASGCQDPIIAELRSPERQTRIAACHRLIADPNPSPRVVAALETCVRDEEPHVRRLAVEALGKPGRTVEDAVPILLEALRDPDKSVRVAAAVAALRIDPTLSEPRAPILSEIRSRNPLVILAIGELGPSADWALPAVRELLSDREEQIRELAQLTITKLQPEEATN